MKGKVQAPPALRLWQAVTPWQRRHPRLSLLLVGVVAALVGAWLGREAVRGVAWQEIGRTMAAFPPLYSVGAVACFLAKTLFRSAAWYVLFPQKPPPVWRLILVENTGIGVNNLLPVRWFSEAVQYAILLVRDRVPSGVALATLAMKRVLDFQANFLLLGMTLPLALRGREGIDIGAILGIAAFLAMGSTLGLHLVGWAYRRWAGFRRLPLLGPMGEAVLVLETRPPRLLLALALTVGQWISLGGAGWFLVQGAGVTIPLPGAVALVILVTFVSTTIPGLLGGLGVFEFASVGILVTFFGADKSHALSGGLLMHALWWIFPVAIALFMLPREGWAALRTLRQRELPP